VQLDRMAKQGPSISLASARVSILWGDLVGEGGGGSGRRNQASGDVDTSPTWIGLRSTIGFVTRWS